MPWFRDSQSPLGPRLRTLVVLVLIFALVTEIPLGVVGGMATWLTLGGMSTVAGSVPPPGAPGPSKLIAASKHKGDTRGKRKGGKKGKQAKSPDVTAASRKKRRQALTPTVTPTSASSQTPTPTPSKKKRRRTPTPTVTPTPVPPTPSPTPTPPGSGDTATLLAAGDIASCSSSGDEATAKLLDGLAGTVATLGDNAYESGTASEYTTCYDPTWGRHKSRTQPAAGNHEYNTAGATGYYGYFGAAAGDPNQGYYSYDLGRWHIVALNSNCSQVGGCGVGSPQEQWLREDLAAHPTTCTLAYWHHPRFSFGNYGNDTRTKALWQALDEAGAEIVLSGHDHNYQRWTPQTPSGIPDEARGIREFVVGTGGKSHYALGSPPANVEKADGDTSGVLQLTLHATSYDWQFVPVAGQSFTDTGSTSCH
jgi:hypothetical protein